MDTLEADAAELEKLLQDYRDAVAGLDDIEAQYDDLLSSIDGPTLRGSPDQPRDEGGRWTSGGGGGGGSGDAGGSSGGGSVGGGAARVEGSPAYAAREAHREARNPADYTPANPDAVETNQRFKTSDGSYTAARAAMHDEVVADALAGVS